MSDLLLLGRRIIAVTGPDAREFLQNLITQDITRVTPDSGAYSCLLSPQGKYQYDFFILPADGSSRLPADGSSGLPADSGFLLDVAAEQAAALARVLTMFKLRADVSVAVRDDLQVQADLSDKGTTAGDFSFRDGALTDGRADGIGRRRHVSGTPGDSDDATYTAHLHRLGIPSLADLIPGKTIMLEAGFDAMDAIGWAKGCFVGQELTARTRYRGLIKKLLIPVTPAAGSGTKLTGETGQIGHMQSPGFALIRRDALEDWVSGGADPVPATTEEGQPVHLHRPAWWARSLAVYPRDK